MSDDQNTNDPTTEEIMLDPAATVEMPAVKKPTDDTDDKPKTGSDQPGPNLDALRPTATANPPGFQPYQAPVPMIDHAEPPMHVGVHPEEPETRFGGGSDFGDVAFGDPFAGMNVPEDDFAGNTKKIEGVPGLHFRSPHGGF